MNVTFFTFSWIFPEKGAKTNVTFFIKSTIFHENGAKHNLPFFPEIYDFSGKEAQIRAKKAEKAAF